MKRVIAVAVMFLGLAQIGKAQCSVQLASAAAPNNIVLNAQWSGSAVVPGLTMSGSGLGETLNSALQAALASSALGTGDFTFTYATPTLSGGTRPEAGMRLLASSREMWIHVANTGAGGLVVYFDWRNPLHGAWNTAGSQSLSTLTNFVSQVKRVGTTYTAYVSTDGGANYASIGSISSNGSGAGYVQFAVDSGDTTNLTTATFTNININGGIPSFSYTGTGSLESGVIQAGTLTLGPDTASGAVTYSFVGAGCDANAIANLQALINNSTFGIQYNFTPPGTQTQYIWNSQHVAIHSGFTDPATITSYPPLPPVVPNFTLVHGTQYTLTRQVAAFFIQNGTGFVWTIFYPINQVIPLNP